MHKISVLTIGLKNFNISLEELKDFLTFKVTFSENLERDSYEDFDVILIQEDFLRNNSIKKDSLNNIKKIKIIATNTKKLEYDFFYDKLDLPTSIKVLNNIIENSVAKKNFNINSSIPIKEFVLNKNEKKLFKNDNFIFLTEKEVQLLELFLSSEASINKEKILKKVWKYADGADTHTVETHIYRLRKKIKEKFDDDKFIINNKKGYSL